MWIYLSLITLDFRAHFTVGLLEAQIELITRIP
jgi:hypothetical protein